MRIADPTQTSERVEQISDILCRCGVSACLNRLEGGKAICGWKRQRRGKRVRSENTVPLRSGEEEQLVLYHRATQAEAQEVIRILRLARVTTLRLFCSQCIEVRTVV